MILGGPDSQLEATQDWALTIRARLVARICPAAATVEHHEGRVSLLPGRAVERLNDALGGGVAQRRWAREGGDPSPARKLLGEVLSE